MAKARDILIALALRHSGDWNKIMKSIREKDALTEEELAQAAETPAITLIDAEYPTSLKQCDRPPFVLFYKGDVNLLKDCSKSIAYVGARVASPYGKRMAEEICSDLAKNGCAMISGMARGIDSIALKSALNNEGKAIAVLGSGIDCCYPKENQDLYDELSEKGLILSEYPGMTSPTTETFPMRNRIVASLASAVIVGEAGKHSGTLITVGYALNMGKDVGCIPFTADADSACNGLIKEGATLIENADDAMLLIGR